MWSEVASQDNSLQANLPIIAHDIKDKIYCPGPRAICRNIYSQTHQWQSQEILTNKGHTSLNKYDLYVHKLIEIKPQQIFPITN